MACRARPPTRARLAHFLAVFLQKELLPPGLATPCRRPDNTRMSQSLSLTVNGEKMSLPPMSLATLIAELGLDTRKVAIERNLEIVPRSTYAQVLLNEGDAIEIVQFVGGG